MSDSPRKPGRPEGEAEISGAVNATFQPKGRHTLQTIADLASVHVSTVSRALDPHRSHRVGADTVARIRRIADEVGYEPNPWARSLRTKRTRTLGLVMPRLVDDVLAVVFESAESAAAAADYQAITMSTGDDQAMEHRVVHSLLDRRVDGLILATARMEDPIVDELSTTSVPFVLLNRASGNHPCVRGDDEQGAYLATRHLLERGHRRMAHIAGVPGTSTAQLRRRGYERALRAAGLPVEDDLVADSGLSIDSGYDIGTTLLAGSARPTAVFATNDYVAIGVMAAARDLGLAIPDDLAVVGFNDARLAQSMLVPLSSVALPLPEIGRRAVEMLVDCMEGRPVESVVLTPRLHIRASSQLRVGPSLLEGSPKSKDARRT